MCLVGDISQHGLPMFLCQQKQGFIEAVVINLNVYSIKCNYGLVKLD